MGLEENYKALGVAVIKQAVSDFRIAFRRLKRRPNDKSAWEECDEIRKFFYSEHFSIFTDLDGPTLYAGMVETLEREMNETSEEKRIA